MFKSQKIVRLVIALAIALALAGSSPLGSPHTFQRIFACILRKAGVDTMTIKDLGRWESLEMVQRYTRSFTFQDSLRFYKAPMS